MKRKGSLLMAAGLLLLAAALLLTLYNLYDQRRAAQAVRQAAEQLAVLTAEPSAAEPVDEETAVPDYLLDPNMEMPTETVDGLDYIGILRIPALGLELPVVSEWSYPALKVAPCRYSGSAYRDDLTVCAHNYTSHFGGLKSLPEGSDVTFTDMDGNVFSYQTAAVEVLPPTAIEDMTDGGWPLTLFTCTVGGQSRVALRCLRVSA